MSTNLSETDLELMRKRFSASPKNRVAQNAVAQTSIDEVALDREVVVGTDTTVSNLLDDWSVTNQKKSGRCWLFAGLNLLRVGAAQAMNLKEFEFSRTTSCSGTSSSAQTSSRGDDRDSGQGPGRPHGRVPSL